MQWHLVFLLLLLYFLEIVDRNSIGRSEENILTEHVMVSLEGNSGIEERKATELLCIRHGVSLANEFIGNRWGSPSFRDDPNLVDAALSKNGIQLTKTELPKQLLQQDEFKSFLMRTKNETTNSNNGGVELVLISPLTRCLQTYVYGVEPVLRKLLNEQDDFQNDNDSQRRKLPIPVLAHPLLRERVYTASDTGRPVAVLEEEFPSIDFSECHKARKKRKGVEGKNDANDIWWYTGLDENGTIDQDYKEWRPHGQGQWYAVPGEPAAVFEKRMEELKNWLFQRKETKILLVTHWGVLRYLSDGVRWENSEAKIIQLFPHSYRR